MEIVHFMFSSLKFHSIIKCNVYYKYIIDFKFIAEAVYTDTHPFQRLIVFINIREYTILFFVLYNEQQA